MEPESFGAGACAVTAERSGSLGQVSGGGGGPIGSGPTPCQPGCKIPTPGSVQTNLPSALTVMEPTASQIPFLWLNEIRACLLPADKGVPRTGSGKFGK